MIGDRIRDARRSMRYSQEQLAELVGVSRQAVSVWECGAKLPGSANLIRLSETLKVSVDWLVGEKKSEAPVQAPDITDKSIDNSFSNTGTITGNNVGNVLITGGDTAGVPDWLEELLTLRRTNRALFKLLATDATDDEIRTMAASLNTQAVRS